MHNIVYDFKFENNDKLRSNISIQEMILLKASIFKKNTKSNNILLKKKFSSDIGFEIITG